MNKKLINSDDVLKGIIIPPCPESLTSIVREAQRPNADLASMGQVISRDVGIVGPLLKLANSPFVGLRSRVSSVHQAISVLGMKNTLNLVKNIALRQSLGGDTQNFDKFWERSSMTASIGEKLAAKFPTVSSNDAYMSALFHDCGIPVLMMKYPTYRETVMDKVKPGRSICDIENDVFYTSHAVVGNMLARSWMLPAPVCKAILYHHDTTILNSASETNEVYDLICILHMAECIMDEHLHVKELEWPQFETMVLNYFEMSTQEFSDLKGDMLAVLNGE